MVAKPVAFLLADLGVTKSHSRPHVSNDNPYSESQFRTLKYRPEFPDRFGCFEDAQALATSTEVWERVVAEATVGPTTTAIKVRCVRDGANQGNAYCDGITLQRIDR